MNFVELLRTTQQIHSTAFINWNYPIVTKTTNESQTSTDEYRRLPTNQRRVTDDYRPVTYKSQIATMNHSERFFEYIYKALFSENIWFLNAPMKRWFLFKKGKSKIWCLLKWWKLSYTRNQTILSFWSPFRWILEPDQQKRRLILLCFYTVAYWPILRHWSLCTATENIWSSQFQGL